LVVDGLFDDIDIITILPRRQDCGACGGPATVLVSTLKQSLAAIISASPQFCKGFVYIRTAMRDRLFPNKRDNLLQFLVDKAIPPRL
jgi:hypothetical protein